MTTLVQPISDIKFKSYCMLQRICDTLEASSEEERNYLDLVIETYKLTSLNDFEISFWALILEKSLKSERSQPLPVLLCYTAYAAKAFSNTFIDNITENLEAKFPEFSNTFRKWIRNNSELLSCTPQEINYKYKELISDLNSKSEQNYINYETIVEELVNNWIKVKDYQEEL
jgi:hypothetical protein